MLYKWPLLQKRGGWLTIDHRRYGWYFWLSLLSIHHVTTMSYMAAFPCVDYGMTKIRYQLTYYEALLIDVSLYRTSAAF